MEEGLPEHNGAL